MTRIALEVGQGGREIGLSGSLGTLKSLLVLVRSRMKSGLSQLPALSHEGFRCLWKAQAVSLVGTTMHNAAILWLVAQLAPAGSKAMALGMLGLVRVIPLLALALVGGVAADRFDRRKLMGLTQTVMALSAAVLALLTLCGAATLVWVYVLTAITAAASAFDGPTRSALVARLVTREHLPSAVSLNTALFQVASMVGPALAGLLLIGVSVGWLFAANALSFLTVIFALRRMKLPQVQVNARSADRGFRAMLGGVRHVFTNPLVRSSMLLDFSVSFFASATTLMPIVAREMLDVGAGGFGLLCAAPSIGAVAASLVLLRSDSVRRRGEAMLWAAVGYGIATILFGVTHNFGVALACLAAMGACDTVNMVLRNVIKQLATPDHLRGRMNGVQILFAQGGPQLGDLEAGLVAQIAGASCSVVTGGIGCLLATAWIAWSTPQLRADRTGAPAPAMVPVPVAVPALAAVTAA
jgi:MFS family permease